MASPGSPKRTSSPRSSTASRDRRSWATIRSRTRGGGERRRVGADPLAQERIWDKLYWTLMPRGQTGYAAHALAAIDVALWDLKGKALKQPVWRLLGGAHPRVPVYATFGFGFFDREQLAAAAQSWVSRGFRRLKMTVANEALRHRDSRPVMDVIREDAARVRAVR